MQSNARRTVFLGLMVLVAGAACTDLTVEPKSTLTSVNAFNEPGSYKAFIAKIYGGLQVSGQEGPAGRPDIQGIDEGFGGYLRLIWQMQELPTDETAIAWNDAGVQELNTQLWGSNNQFLGAMYGRVYFQVGLANEFLRQTTDALLAARGISTVLTAQVRQYRAEARFLAAPDIGDDGHLQPVAQSRQDAGFHAVVGRQAHDIEVVHAASAQQLGQASAGGVAGLKCRVGVLGRAHPFRDEQGLGGQVEVSVELRAVSVHHTVCWPDPTVALEVRGFGPMPVARDENRHARGGGGL